ncbi:MAG: AbrB/MazE/SpoVT family DNA-binding domain-containing protein [Candidatus Omnitrophica bacterium]|nr:AbrB/MazE/SpoVT family DNA-binding domain-containing protein [Candidatus Omnitrophota bacterium]
MMPIFKGKVYGSVTIGERGQLVIPAELRKALKLKTGDQLMVFAKVDRGIISLMSSNDLSTFLEKAEKAITKLENRISVKS